MDQMILANLADMTNVVSDVAGEESELPGEINDVMQVIFILFEFGWYCLQDTVLVSLLFSTHSIVNVNNNKQ